MNNDQTPESEQTVSVTNAAPQVNPTQFPAPPPEPTREELAAAMAKRRAEFAEQERSAQAAHEKRVREQAERNERLVRRAIEQARHEFEKKGKDLEHEDGAATWTDVVDAKPIGRLRVWKEDLTRANKLHLANWKVSQIENRLYRAEVQQFLDQLAGPESNLPPGMLYQHRETFIMWGGQGGTKTSTAIAMGHETIARGLITRFVTHQHFMQDLGKGGEPPYHLSKKGWMQRLIDADVLIFDDFGAGVPAFNGKADTDTLSLTTELFEARAIAGRINIVTTNLTSDSIVKMFDDRLVSRMAQDGHAVEFKGHDRRGPVAWGSAL